jgi:hypothetical protein
LQAPVSRVWRALTDHQEFGQWFRVNLEGPLVPGQTARGRITHPGYEHLVWQAMVHKMEPERAGGGTLLTLVESGFDKVPARRRDEAYRMNDVGWTAQMQNIARHLGERD